MDTKRDAVRAMVSPLQEYQLEKMYDDVLDDVFGEVMIAGLPYQTSRALKLLDPTAYRCGLSDWLASEESLVEIDGEVYVREEIDQAIMAELEGEEGPV